MMLAPAASARSQCASTPSTRMCTSDVRPISAGFARLHLELGMEPAGGADGAIDLAEAERVGQEPNRGLAVLVEQVRGDLLSQRLDLEQHSVALATAGADRGEPEAAAVAVQLVDHRRQDPGS
jgi:hypothetical protein